LGDAELTSTAYSQSSSHCPVCGRVVGRATALAAGSGVVVPRALALSLVFGSPVEASGNVVPFYETSTSGTARVAHSHELVGYPTGYQGPVLPGAELSRLSAGSDDVSDRFSITLCGTRAASVVGARGVVELAGAPGDGLPRLVLSVWLGSGPAVKSPCPQVVSAAG